MRWSQWGQTNLMSLKSVLISDSRHFLLSHFRKRLCRGCCLGQLLFVCHRDSSITHPSGREEVFSGLKYSSTETGAVFDKKGPL